MKLKKKAIYHFFLSNFLLILYLIILHQTPFFHIFPSSILFSCIIFLKTDHYRLGQLHLVCENVKRFSGVFGTKNCHVHEFNLDLLVTLTSPDHTDIFSVQKYKLTNLLEHANKPQLNTTVWKVLCFPEHCIQKTGLRM